MKKDRRKFFTSISLATAGIVGSGFIPKKALAEKKVKWKMVTSWPKNFPGLGAGAETLANYIQTNFGLIQHHGWSLNELDDMHPWEREIYVGLMVQHIEEEKLRREREQRKR